MNLQDYIQRRKQEIKEMIQIDHDLDIDSYEDVGKLKEVEKIEKLIHKFQTGNNLKNSG